MQTTTLLAAVYLLLYLPLIGYVYGRQRRWTGAIGWGLLMGGALLALGGAGDAFPWGGLLWSFVAASGLLLIAFDAIATRRERG